VNLHVNLITLHQCFLNSDLNASTKKISVMTSWLYLFGSSPFYCRDFLNS